MRYPLAWAETAKQNSILKYSLLLSSTLTAILLISTLILSLKKPIVIDRACYSSFAKTTDSERTDQEIDAFLRSALEMRFSTENMGSSLSWLSPNEELAKSNEQKEFKSKNIRQKILVSSISIKGNTAVVEIDRILSVEKLRSVLPATITVQISSIARSESNPYGLLVESVELRKEVKVGSSSK